MLAMERKPVDFTHDLSYYAKDSRLTGEPDGKRYQWRAMIERFKRSAVYELLNLFPLRFGIDSVRICRIGVCGL